MNSYRNNSGHSCEMPPFKAMSTSKTTQTEDDCFDYTSPQEQNLDNTTHYNRATETWDHPFLPMYPAYNPIPAYAFWQMQQARSVNQLCMPWYPLQAFSPYFPFNLSATSPSMIQLPLIVPSCTNILRPSQEVINISSNTSLQRSKSECATARSQLQETKMSNSAGSSLQYFTIVNDENNSGAKRLEKRCMKNRSVNRSKESMNCATDTISRCSAVSKESVIESRASQKSSSHVQLDQNESQVKSLYPKCNVNEMQPPKASLSDKNASRELGLCSRSECLNPDKHQPIIKRYINRNLIDSSSKNNQKLQFDKQYNSQSNDFRIGAGKSEITENIHKLADLLCDFNVRDEDEKNQFYSDIIKRAIDLALQGSSEKPFVKTRKSKKISNREILEKVESLSRSFSSNSVRTSNNEMKRVVSGKTSEPNVSSQLKNRKKMKLIYASKYYESEVNPVEKSNSSSSYYSDNSLKNSQEPQQIQQLNERMPYKEYKNIKDNSMGPVFNSKSGQSVDSNKSEQWSSSSTVSTSCSYEKLTGHNYSNQMIPTEKVCSTPENDTRRDFCKTHVVERDTSDKSFDKFTAQLNNQSKIRMNSDSNMKYTKYYNDTFSEPAEVRSNKDVQSKPKLQNTNVPESIKTTDFGARSIIDNNRNNCSHRNVPLTSKSQNDNHLVNVANNYARNESKNVNFPVYKTNPNSDVQKKVEVPKDDLEIALNAIKIDEIEKSFHLPRKITPPSVEKPLQNVENTNGDGFNNKTKNKFESITAHFILPNCKTSGKKDENVSNISSIFPPNLTGSKDFTEFSFSVNYDPENPERIMVDCKQNGESLKDSSHASMKTYNDTGNKSTNGVRSSNDDVTFKSICTQESLFHQRENDDSGRFYLQKLVPDDPNQSGVPQVAKHRSRFSQYSILNNVETLSVISEGDEDRYTNTTMRSTTTNSSNSEGLGEMSFPIFRNYMANNLVGQNQNLNDINKFGTNIQIYGDCSRIGVNGVTKRITKLEHRG